MAFILGLIVGVVLVLIPAIYGASKAAEMLAEMQEWLERATCGGRYTHILWRNGAGQIKQLELSGEMRWLLQANLRNARRALDERRIRNEQETN